MSRGPSGRHRAGRLLATTLALTTLVGGIAGCGRSAPTTSTFAGLQPAVDTQTAAAAPTMTVTVAGPASSAHSATASAGRPRAVAHQDRRPRRAYRMYDTLYPSILPRSSTIIASYVGDGRTGFTAAQQIFPDAQIVSINESPGDPVPADFWGDEQDVTAAGWPRRGYTGGGGWSAAEVAAAIAHGLAKGAYGTPGPGFGLSQIQSLLTRVYHIPRSHYLLWSDGLVGHHRLQSIPPGADANQNAIDLGDGSYDEDRVTSNFLTRLGLAVPRAG